MRAVLVVLLLAAVPVSANLDPATGDYAFIDNPNGGGVMGLVTFNGTAGKAAIGARCGSETTPLTADGAPGDTNQGYPGADVQRAWVCEDNGASFEVRLRVNDGPPSTLPQSTVQYGVQFTHAGTGVRYRALAHEDFSAGWLAQLLYQQSGTPVTWCAMAGATISASWTDDPPSGYVTFVIDYADLYMMSTGPSCGGATGYTTVAGDVLTAFSAESSAYTYGPGFTSNLAQDTTPNGATTWILGPPTPPVGPFTPVEFFVNGNLVGTFSTQNAAGLAVDEWIFDVDFGTLDPVLCDFTVNVTYGTAWDAWTFTQIGCAPPPPPPPPVVNQPKNERPASQPRDSTSGAAWVGSGSDDDDLDGYQNGADACIIRFDPDVDGDGTPDRCDPDIDGDGILNAADNCPTVANPDQVDTDHDGVGDMCLLAFGLDQEKDAQGNIVGDGIRDDEDNCPLLINPRQFDLDQDGIGNECDEDVDGDGVIDQDLAKKGLVLEPLACRFNPYEWEDTDGDGICDNADADLDNDGYTNDVELAAGTDPRDAQSMPQPMQAHTHAAAAGPGALGGTLILVLLIAIGVGLFFLLGGRKT